MLQNPRWERFAQELYKGESQRNAYRTAYPNFKGKDETADKRGSELAKRGEIVGRLQELQREEEKSAILSVEERKRLLTQFALNDDVKDTDRLKALDILNKMESSYTTVVKADVDMALRLEDLI